MNKRSRAAIALTVGAALAVGPALSAQAASSSITNGGFEADAIGSTSVTGWTAITQAIDLGVSSIAGCTTVDTSDYTNLREYADEAEAVWDRTYANVPDLDSDHYYVHDAFTGDPITILGDRLVWNDWDGFYLLEVAMEPVGEPDFSFSSVTDPGEGDPAPEPEPAPETEPAPQPEETTPVDPEPSEPAPSEPAPSEPTPADPAPSEPAPSEPAPSDPAPENEPEPVSPVEALYSYLGEWDWSIDQWNAFDAAESLIPDPSERGDTPAYAGLDEESYEISIVDGADVDREGKVLELSSDLGGDFDGYVIHGPAIVSAPFTVPAGRQISLDWKAVDDSDDFHVFGYLLNTSTCAQTEVIDATGELQDWTTTSVEIPSAGTYRFVFVSGSYDKSWGGAAGAYMYIDNIVQTAVFSSPGVEVSLAAGVGDYLPGSDVSVSGGGLEPESAYDLVLRSTPVTVTQGTTDLDGRFVQVVSLPENIPPGAHTITLTGQGPSGPLTEVVYITVGSDGTLLYLSTEGPQPALAMTGPAENAGITGLALLLVLTGAAAVELERRRRSPFSAVYVR
ncbi:hypothetical protein [Microcella sp.]|uniref:hypothetical protein n=1 Tax=Microcella sp. TaxID=1913979 RepID=UPI00391D7FAF